MKKNSIESQNLSFEERAAIVYKNKPKGKNKKKAIL